MLRSKREEKVFFLNAGEVKTLKKTRQMMMDGQLTQVRNEGSDDVGPGDTLQPTYPVLT